MAKVVDYFKIVGWTEFKDILYEKYNIKFKNLDSFYNERNVFHEIGDDYLEKQDTELFELLNELCEIEGTVYIITDASFRERGGVFLLNADNLTRFINEHMSSFRLNFFSTDTLIFNLKKDKLWLFHHEGYYSFIDLKIFID